MNKTYHIIGDSHGKIEKMLSLIKPDKNYIQIGDMAMGWTCKLQNKTVNIDETITFPHNLRFIRGNHDNPQMCQAHPNFLGDYGYIEEDSLFYLGGAWSIDWIRRIPGLHWWADEELSDEQFVSAIELYKQVKPKYVITHDCPLEATYEMRKYSSFTQQYVNLSLDSYFLTHGRRNPTQLNLQKMFEFHQPIEWVYGHFHVDHSFNMGRTKFMCVNELSTYELVCN